MNDWEERASGKGRSLIGNRINDRGNRHRQQKGKGPFTLEEDDGQQNVFL